MLSIRRVLLAWLLGIVLFGVVLAGVLIYRQAQSEANALFDYQLQQTAAALPSEPFSSVLGSNASNGDGVVIQIWSRDGAQLYYSHPRSPLAPRAELGFSTERTPAGDWRVYSAIVGDNVVQLAQPMAIRNLLAAETAWRTVWPLLILLPVLGIGVWLIVGRGLRPLSRLAHALEARRPEAVDPLPDRKLPPEIRPVVHALNGLLQRLNVAFDTQKAFVADAAHELRTPLAALRIQTQLLERAGDAAARGEALADLKHGVERATRLVEQLLSLARAEAGAASLTIDGMPESNEDARAREDRLVSASAGAQGTAGVTDVDSDAASHGSGAPWMDGRRDHRDLPPRHRTGVQLTHHEAGGDAGVSGKAASSGTVDLLALVESCVAARAPLSIDKGVDLGIEEASPARIHGDADALEVMIGNLLDNAVKYTPTGGKIDVSLGCNERQQTYLEIVDTGPGIPVAERERVFDRFYRCPNVTDADSGTVVQGSGLGLAIVKRIADAHRALIYLSERQDPAESGLRVRVLFGAEV